MNPLSVQTLSRIGYTIVNSTKKSSNMNVYFELVFKNAIAGNSWNVYLDMEWVDDGDIPTSLQLFAIGPQHTNISPRCFLIDLTTKIPSIQESLITGILKKILHSTSVQKLAFDPREDIRVLHKHYGIKINRIRCLQETYKAYLVENSRDLQDSLRRRGLIEVLERELGEDHEFTVLKRSFKHSKKAKATNSSVSKNSNFAKYAANDVICLPLIDRFLLLTNRTKKIVNARCERMNFAGSGRGVDPYILELATSGIAGEDQIIASFDVLSPSQRTAIDHFLEYECSLFITGEAGTGKSRVVEIIRLISSDKGYECVALAPTGVAAINITGITITSFFKIPVSLIEVKQVFDFRGGGKYVLREKNSLHWKIEPDVRDNSQKVDVIIIDEVSMMNIKLLELVNVILQVCRNNLTPFGGVRIIFVGDFMQLPPVPVTYIQDNGEHDQGENEAYAFKSELWNSITTVKLTDNFRQNDHAMLRHLANVRCGNLTTGTYNYFVNRSVKRKHVTAGRYDNHVLLVASNKERMLHNDRAFRRHLRKGVNPQTFTLNQNVNVPISPRIYNLNTVKAIPKEIKLYPGARVVCIRNVNVYEGGGLRKHLDKDKSLMNGDTGTVTNIVKDKNNETVFVKRDRPGIYNQEVTVEVKRKEWEIISYNGKKVLKIFQIPLDYGWAVTVHKAQGRTIEKLVVDCKKIGIPGQAYTAFSRATNINGFHVVDFRADSIRAPVVNSEFY